MQKNKIITICMFLVFIGFTVAVFFLVGKPLIQFVSEPEKFRAWVDEIGILANIAFVGMMAFQVVFAIIPGEPLEMGAGYAFGTWTGALLCVIGSIIGSVIVFCFTKKFGMKFVTVFISKEKLESIKFLQNEKKLTLFSFILFLSPGTPKDVMSYFIGLTPMKLSTWIFITAVARFPSVITSTVAGDALGTQNYVFAVVAFVVTGVISIAGIIVYNKILKNKEEKKNEAGE